MNNRVVKISLLLTFFLLMGCGTVTTIRPIRKGESAFALSLGGPVTNVSGMNIPIPYTVIRYRYGLRDNLNLYGGSHLLLFALGDIGLDAGLSYYFLKQEKWIPEVGIGAGIYGFSKPGKDSRAFPELELTGSYIFGNRFLTYFGTQSIYQFKEKPYIVLSPFIGEEVRVSKKFSITLETKWYAPGEVTRPRVIDYKIPISNHGALGVVFGLNYLLGG
jgi:hypothetical protein